MLSLSILIDLYFNLNYIKNYIEDENWINIILIAIKNHNKYKIEKGINKKKELFCKIIRDADKADIMYEGANIFWNKESEKINLENAKIRQEEIEAVKKHTLIDRRKIDKESELDGMLIMLCFIFDINYHYLDLNYSKSVLICQSLFPNLFLFFICI